MIALVTGQVGIDKKPFLEAVERYAGERGETIGSFHVGSMMYKEAPDITQGRILGLPWSRLTSLRRAVFKDIIRHARETPHAVINTHATFRWRHGLFSAIDFDQIKELAPDLFLCVVDNIEVVHHRLHNEHEIDATLKDCMVWREEEILVTELLATALGKPFYIFSRGRHQDNLRMMHRLVCRPDMRKVYPSFPMSHVMDMPDVLAEIDGFRAKLAEHFITFDPGDVDEKILLDTAIANVREGLDFVEINLPPDLAGATRERVPVRQVLDIAGDIDGQIYMRDFKLIDQADMIVSLVPELPGGNPGLSSGVERELQHAWEHTKEVYVVWKPKKAPSPFITETATKIFDSVDEALEYFESRGMFKSRSLFDA